MAQSVKKPQILCTILIAMITFLLVTCNGTLLAAPNTDSEQVAAAKTALAAAGTLKPVRGIESNVISMAQDIVNQSSTGVKVTISSSSNWRISLNGDIRYGTTVVTDDVTFKLTKNSATATQAVPVTVPLMTPITTSTTTNTTNNTTTTNTATTNTATTNTATTNNDTVPTGAYNVKNYGAKGDGSTDDTIAINSAINTAYSKGGGTVYVPAGTYLVDTATSILLKSNIKLSMASGATLKAKPTSSGTYKIVQIKSANNVSIEGGAIVGDRLNHSGTSGEWGMGINVVGSNYINISDITIANCWGDGIYVGATTTQNYCQNVTIERFVADNNRRNGINVVSAKSMIIRNGTISNTNGVRPEEGLNFEPNLTSQFLQNILVENLITKNNAAYGIHSSFSHYLGTPNAVSINIKNHVDYNSAAGARLFYLYTPSSTCKITVM